MTGKFKKKLKSWAMRALMMSYYTVIMVLVEEVKGGATSVKYKDSGHVSL